MKQEDLFENMVSQQIGDYAFKNPALLRQAFTRRSYSEENGGENNEVLEFIGDKVLDICVIRYLVGRYGTDLHVQDKIPASFRVPEKATEFASELDEGELTKIKQRMVSKNALADRIDELDLARFLIMGKGDSVKSIDDEPSVKEDLFEAIVGAVALDSNWDFEKLQQVVEIMLCPDSFLPNDDEPDYVGLIYDWDSKMVGTVPYFMYFDGGVSRHWYNKEENVIYSDPTDTYGLNHCNHACQVKIRDDLYRFEAYGESKNEARKNACKAAYEYLIKNNLVSTIKDEIDEPIIDMAINQLEILARRGYFPLPEYDYVETHDKDGNPVWSVRCYIDEYGYFGAVSSSKKQAKKMAAYDMLLDVLENYEDEF